MTATPTTALAGYRKLADSSVGVAARSRAAAMLLARNERAGALAMLDDYAALIRSSEFELTLTKARLLADHGESGHGPEPARARRWNATRTILRSNTTEP